MKIKVKFFARLREITGVPEITLNFEKKQLTVKEVIEALIRQYHEMRNELLFQKSFELKPIYKLMVDGQNISNRTGLSHPVQEGSVLRFFPPVYGG